MTYVPTPTAFIYNRSAGGTVSSKLAALITSAAAARTFTTPDETFALPLGSQICGPRNSISHQGVVRIEYDPASAPNVGTNRLIMTAAVSFASNVRLEIDSGVCLADGTGSATGMFTTTGFNNWSITRGNPAYNLGYYQIDTSYDTANLKSRLTHCQNSTNFMVEWAESIQAAQTSSSATCTIPFHPPSGTVTADGFTKHPRNFIVRRCKNSGSESGWGLLQISGAANGYFNRFSSNGGTLMRFETDGLGTSTNGLSNILAEGPFFLENGNYVCTMTPHAAFSDRVVVTGVYGISCYGGLFLGGEAQGGWFTNSSVTTGCIVAGTTAEQPGSPNGKVNQSHTAVDDNTTAHPVTYSGIGRSGSFSAGAPGGDTGVSCNTTIDRAQQVIAEDPTPAVPLPDPKHRVRTRHSGTTLYVTDIP